MSFIRSIFSAGPDGGDPSSPFSAFSGTSSSNSVSPCANCGLRPRQTDPGNYDPSYCGPGCAGDNDYSAQRWEGRGYCARFGCDEHVRQGEQFCSQEHAKAAVVDGQVPGCNTCHVFPQLLGKKWCSAQCEARATASPPPSQPNQMVPETPTPGANDDKDALIRQRFTKRWTDPANRTTPDVRKLQEISLRPQIQERWDRYTQLLEERGGFSIKSTFYGGRCECGLASEDPRSNPCKSTTCRVCRVIRSAFAGTAKAPAHIDQGSLGPGIYTKMNPADAHKHAEASPGTSLRVIILCSVAVPKVSGDSSEDPTVEENGRCFCPTKDSIIPRWVIVYGVKQPQKLATPSPQPRKVSNGTHNPPGTPTFARSGTLSPADGTSAEKDRKIRQLEAKIKWLEQALQDEREKNKDLTDKLAAGKKAPAKPADGIPPLPQSRPPAQVKDGARPRANSLPGDRGRGEAPSRQSLRPEEDDDELPDLPPGKLPRRPRGSASAGGSSSGFSDKPQRTPKRIPRRHNRPADYDDLPDNPPGSFPDDLPEYPPWDPNSSFGAGPGPFQQANFGWGPQAAPPPGWGAPPFGGYQQYGPPPPAGQTVFAGPPLLTCLLQGCNATVHSKEGKYCSNQHRKDAVAKDGMPACILCKEYPKAVSQFCGQKCLSKAQGQAPLIINIDQKDAMFSNIVNQFDISWRHTNKPKPTVVYVYKIVLSKQLSDLYLAYQTKVESEGNFKAQGKSAGNECRRWHGTKRLCNVGDNPANLALCPQTTGCAMCSILRSSFQVTFLNTSGRAFNRFGKGIYASSTSSKAHDYAVTVPASPYKAIMLTNVIVGLGHKLTQDSVALTGPPTGCHSVLGETGGSLNYDEVVVYNDDAIRPSWLVVYQ